ncbi:MAG: DUF2634 domain-containing protein [Clostridia bacterium]|nr:DUF2634 domain-containing protein [Clostridia bacterium]
MALFSYGGQQNLPLMQEVGVDFHTGQPLLEPDGSFRLVSGLEAVRVWVWRALQPDNTRYAYSAHTVSYGNQFHLLAGKSLPQAESRMAGLVRETLLVCPYITGVERFSFRREGSRLIAAFTVRTVYGEMSAESEATL